MKLDFIFLHLIRQLCILKILKIIIYEVIFGEL